MNQLHRIEPDQVSASTRRLEELQRIVEVQEQLGDLSDEQFVEPSNFERFREWTRVQFHRIQNHMQKRARLVVGAVLILTAALLAYWYALPSAVSTYTIPSEPIWVQVSGPGILDALQKVTVTSRSAGFLKSVRVESTDNVAAGELLAELETVEIESQLAVAQAEAQASRLAVDQTKSEQTVASAAQEKALADLQRRRSLRESGTVSVAEFDAAVSQSRQADATVERAKVTTQRSIAQVLAAEAQVRVLTNKLDETKIRSPMAAVVVARERSLGDLLAPGTTLFRLADPSSIVVSTRFDESGMGIIQPGQQATLQFVSAPKSLVKGKVLRVARSVDPETREFVIDVIPDELPPNWAIGQRSKVTISARLPQEVIAIPQEMVARRNGSPGVWKLSYGSAKWASIELGLVAGDYVEIASGVSRGDTLLSPLNRYQYERIWSQERSK